MVLKQVDEEKGIAKYPDVNVKQYDLLGYYDDVLIASLWQDAENGWHWTKRLYGIERVVDMGIYDSDFKDVVCDFIDQVTEWLNDEIKYIQQMCDDLEDDIRVEQ